MINEEPNFRSDKLPSHDDLERFGKVPPIGAHFEVQPCFYRNLINYKMQYIFHRNCLDHHSNHWTFQ